MSRFDGDDCDGGDYPNLDSGRYNRNASAVLTSKRGQAVLREIEQALLALPVKELIEGDVIATSWGDDDELILNGTCLIGAYALHKGVPFQEIDFDDGPPSYEVADWAVRKLGLRETLAYVLMWQNDESCAACTRVERYEHCLAWVRRHIAAPAVTP